MLNEFTHSQRFGAVAPSVCSYFVTLFSINRSPFIDLTRLRYALEVHAYKVHNCEVHACKVHAREMYARKVYAREMYACEMHACKIHAYLPCRALGTFFLGSIASYKDE
jgi:hypothetical protein